MEGTQPLYAGVPSTLICTVVLATYRPVHLSLVGDIHVPVLENSL